MALGTNDIDFRSRPHSEEEREFLAAVLPDLTTTYADIDKADHVVLLVLNQKKSHRSFSCVSIAKFESAVLRSPQMLHIAIRGSKKLKATLVKSTSDISGLTANSVILVGERAAETQGALSSALALAQLTGAKLGWIPRRAR